MDIQPPTPSISSPKKWWSYLVYAIIGLLVVAVVVVATVIYAMHTTWGTKVILDKIATQTNVKLNYDKGDLWRGVWLDGVEIDEQDIKITANRAYIQVGWRAILFGQAHLSKLHIDKLSVIDNSPPKDEPFAYDTLRSPIALSLQNATITHITYHKLETNPVYIHDLNAKSITWKQETVSLKELGLRYDEILQIHTLSGDIALAGEYPLSATAKVQVYALNEAYVETLDTSIYGTLKRTVGRVTSQYNGHEIHGDFVVQSMDKGVPFSANVYIDDVALPYATEQNIRLSQGQISASGVVEDIELRINTHLTAKDIPQGVYQGRATVTFDGMDIHHLQATTQAGIITAQGMMRWDTPFELQATIQGDQYHIRQALPKDHKEYQAYLPELLTGELAVNYQALDEKNRTAIDLALTQKSGEHIAIQFTQAQNTPNAPWYILAKWQNLVRHQVPTLDIINSPKGHANVVLADNDIQIDATATVVQLSDAPQGEYTAKVHIANANHITIENATYQGEMGEALANAQIWLATATSPLAWNVHLDARQVFVNTYLGQNATPIQTISGVIEAEGKMHKTAHNHRPSVRHMVDIRHSDLTAKLTDGNEVAILGQGQTQWHMADTVVDMGVEFDGVLTQSHIPSLGKSEVSVKLTGDLQAIDISKFTVFNQAGKVSAAGNLKLDDGIGWQMHVHADELDTGKFVDDDVLQAVITGDLATSGAYQAGKFSQTTAKFEGKVHNNAMAGEIVLDVLGEDTRFDIHQFSHMGQAGHFMTHGWADIEKRSWNLSGKMAQFDIGAFLGKIDGLLTGEWSVAGDWGQAVKKVAVNTLNLSGEINHQPFSAKGTAQVELALPKNLQGYFESLKATTQPPKSTDELINLQKHLEANARQAQHIVQRLQADDLMVQLGDNLLHIDGTQQQLTASLKVVDLSQIIAKARGAIDGGVILINDKNALPTIYVDLTAEGVRAANVIIQKASVLGKVLNFGQSPSQLLIDVEDLIAFGRVIKSARVDFEGTQQSHRLAITSKNANVEARAKISGGFDQKQGVYQGIMSEGKVQTKFGSVLQRQPAQFSYGIAQNQIRIAPHCWQTAQTKHQSGSVCLQDTLSYSNHGGHVDVVLQELDTSVLSDALPSDMVWQSTVNGHVKARWQDNQAPVLSATIYSDNGKVGVNQEDAGYIELPYKRIFVVAKTVATGLQIRTEIDGGAGQGYADVIIDPNIGKQTKPILGKMALNNINLAVIRPFFPNLQALSGVANVSGDVGGTLSQPLLYGNARLSNGHVVVVGMPMVVSDIELVATIDGTQARLDGKFRGGEGKGVIDGQIDWRHHLQAKLGVRGEHLTVSSPPMLMAELSPDIEIIIKPNENYVDIQGVVSVPSAVIRPPEATASIINESADVNVLDRRLSGNIDEILVVSKPWNINANLGVDLGDDVVFRGFGAKLPLAGALHLTQSGRGVMQAKGVVQVAERAKIDGIGQNLELNYAQVRFNGDVLNPRLSIEGEKQIEGQTVGLRIKGTATSPDITVFNDAGLSEQQAMNALVTGRISETTDSQISQQSFRSQVTNNLAAAGLNVGLSGTRNITNQIGQALGLESLTVDASGNSSDTSVNVTGYISPDLYIRYGVGVFNAQSTLSMRYQLTRRVYIEATRATENLVDVIYRWKF